MRAGRTSGGQLVVNFQRKLVSTDNAQDVSISGTAQVQVSWAIGRSATIDLGHDSTATARGLGGTLVWLTPVGPPSAPQSLTVTAYATTSLAMAWTAPAAAGSSAVTSYELQVATASSGPYSVPAGYTSSLALSFTITGLSENVLYYVQVRAVSAAGPGPFTTVPFRTLQAGALVPADPTVAPQKVQATQTSVELSWTATDLRGSPLMAYLVEYELTSAVSTSTKWKQGYSGASLSAVVTGLTEFTDYSWRYTVQSQAGSSKPSPIVSITTLAYSSCPSANASPCSGHGSCVKGLCQCQAQWLKADCSQAAEAVLTRCWSNDQHCLRWAYDSSNLYVQTIFTTANWGGIIWGGTGAMNGDAWLVNVLADGTAQVSDRTSTTTVVPTVDTEQNVEAVTGYRCARDGLVVVGAVPPAPLLRGVAS